MKIKRHGRGRRVLSALLVVVGLLLVIESAIAKDPQVPRFVVDPFWPKRLPSDPASGRPWVTGDVAGICVDSHDHVFTLNANNLIAPETVIATPAPPVLAYDRDGNVVAAWGDLAILPAGIHGCFVDHQDNVWIAGSADGIVQKYSHEGTLLLQIGTKGVCDNPPAN